MKSPPLGSSCGRNVLLLSLHYVLLMDALTDLHENNCYHADSRDHNRTLITENIDKHIFQTSNALKSLSKLNDGLVAGQSGPSVQPVPLILPA